MPEPVAVREFSSRADAEVVRDLLLSAGIDAFVESDDCGSIDPALTFARGARVVVAAEDAGRAEELIAEGLAEGVAEAEESAAAGEPGDAEDTDES